MDPLFPKRVDAKPAVCLLALSQGLGNYIRGIQDSIDNKLSPEMRVLANTRFMQALSAECARVRQGNRTNFVYSMDRDGEFPMKLVENQLIKITRSSCSLCLHINN